MKRLFLLLVIPFYALGTIIPDIATPDGFSEQNFKKIMLKKGDYLADIGDCEGVFFKKFYPPGHHNYPSSSGPAICTFSIDIIDMGYGAPEIMIPERVYFDKKSGLWKKKKYVLNREEIEESLARYGIKSLKELRPIELYNIQSVNARGYAVIDRNIFPFERQQGVKEKLSYCLIYESGGVAFCDHEFFIKQVDSKGKEIDFMPYMLKSLETVEMGLPENKTN